MTPVKQNTAVVMVRVPVALARRLSRETRRRRQTRSQLAREILESALGADRFDLAAEARRQSLFVSRRRSEQDALRFIIDTADTTGWT